MDIDTLSFDANGLLTVVVQDRHDGDIRMVAHANREAVERTLASGDAWFYSRSRKAMWRKGETSGHTIKVVEVWADCDGDALLYLADPVGPSCHTGQVSCFFHRLDAEASADASLGQPTFLRLERTIEARKAATSEKSYTRSLLEGGAAKIGAKIVEEAGELVQAITSETDERVDSEAGDVLFHVLVGLRARGRTLRDVAAVLARRFGKSGHAEKASRT
jgi:phosphoribosyl-AMP cyclohydrolase / phosphoribosyl-ATP pyrophosphohydrolase